MAVLSASNFQLGQNMRLMSNLIRSVALVALGISTGVAPAQEPRELNDRVPLTNQLEAVSRSNVFAPSSPVTVSPTPPGTPQRVTNIIVRMNQQRATIPDSVSTGSPTQTKKPTAFSTRSNPNTWPEPMPSQLVVIASQPMVTGEKTVVKLAMKNGLTEEIESARVAIFLLDDQGKVVGQPVTRWVIGGSEDKPGLPPGATNSFHFVVTGDKTLPATNLTAKINFSRIVLEGGKVGDATRDVMVQHAK